MVSSRMAALLDALAAIGDRRLGTLTGERCAEAPGVDGLAASLTLAAGGRRGELGELVWFSDETSSRLDDVRFTLGEGPGVDASSAGVLVLEPDLRTVPAWRWPGFLPPAQELGAIRRGDERTMTAQRVPSKAREGRGRG